MFLYIAKKIFGTSNDRILKSLKPLVMKVNELEPAMQALSDDELRNQTAKFKERLARGEKLESLEAEAFATVREASRRVLGMRHFDVQLIGGAVLNRGMIAEMKTGEGKTLVATLAAYLNALTGEGVHVVTVNDYLAKRDSEWMGRIYQALGLSVGCVYPGQREEAKRQAYQADITYGQNNEFGFDYLRDNMKYAASDMYQRGHAFAIVDEVDSILIDEARTPLIISGPAEDATELYQKANLIIPKLVKEEHYTVELKTKQPTLTEVGIAKSEELLGVENLYDPHNIGLLHHVNQALKAHTTLERDVDYVVNSGEIVIVDEFTGRLMAGRRWSNGLHQAVEAKEGVRVERENQTLASITFQNYFRMYKKLSGMTGTADTEAVEFNSIYKLNVVVIPTNKPMVRFDESDQVYRSRREKYNAVILEIEAVHKSGQPVLVGTISIEQSESLAKQLKERGIPHTVLNAKQHEREASIVAQAGRLGSLTISTNMAGRGTDIVLGGNPEFMAFAEAQTKDRNDPTFIAALEKFKAQCAAEKEKVLQAGGLYIIGTERHESRRIDNQLRGRAGRQGDPGHSRFYVSLEDDLMLRFGGDRIQALMGKFGWEEGVALDGRLISRTIENSQKRVESFHFESRKHVTDYDDVMNKQRQVIYNLRAKILQNTTALADTQTKQIQNGIVAATNAETNGTHSELAVSDRFHESATQSEIAQPTNAARDEILVMVDDLLEELVLTVCSEDKKPMDWDIAKLKERFEFLFNAPAPLSEDVRLDSQVIFDELRAAAKAIYARQADQLQEKLSTIERLCKEMEVSISLNGPSEDDKPFSFTSIEQNSILEALDHFWNQHLQTMDQLREGIGLRGYGQKNPLHEYQKEGFVLFQEMMLSFKEAVVRRVYLYQVPDPQTFVAELKTEKERREKLTKAAQAVHDGEVAPAEGEVDENSPEAKRAKLAAQRKERRKGK